MNIAEKCDTIENENPNNRRNPLVANNVNVKKLEADLWESADLLRAGSKLTSNQYCMPTINDKKTILVSTRMGFYYYDT